MSKPFLSGFRGGFLQKSKEKPNVCTSKTFLSSLPPEIWHKIFQFLLEEDEKDQVENNRGKLRQYGKDNQAEDTPCQKNMTILNFSHVNRTFRSFFLPKIWECLTLNSIYSIQLYESFFSATSNAKEIYGKYIKEIRFEWKIHDLSQKSLQGRSNPLEYSFSHIHQGPDGQGPLTKIKSFEAFQIHMKSIFRLSINLEKLHWVSSYMPFTKYLCNVVEKYCSKLYKFSLEDRMAKHFFLRVPKSMHKFRTHFPCIKSSLKQLEVLGDFPLELNDTDWYTVDVQQPFGIRFSTEQDANYDFRSPAWLMKQIEIGVQHSLKHVTLGCMAIFAKSDFHPLLISLDSAVLKFEELLQDNAQEAEEVQSHIDWLRYQFMDVFVKQESLSLMQHIDVLLGQLDITPDWKATEALSDDRRKLMNGEIENPLDLANYTALMIYKDIPEILQPLEKVANAKRDLINQKSLKESNSNSKSN